MNFKVGDKVRCLKTRGNGYGEGVLPNNIFTVSGISGNKEWLYLCEPTLNPWKAEDFELVKEEPQEIKVGDVWASGNKTLVVKVVGKTTDGIFSYVALNGKQKGMAYADTYKMLRDGCYPLLLHREPPKQNKAPKPQQKRETEEREEFGCDQFVFDVEYKLCPQTNAVYAKIPVYAFENFEGVARLKKGDKFDTFKGREIAAWKLIRNIANAKLDELCK